ncbi:mRNA-capping enzyme subunit beta [Physocladia obscura]|uniref:mRNA-capping enzyme subunit beta n=1 Tax=Physocladia obscura TaxID=109957 RepID=A0AAD5XHL3_9FUNG|nr:mRNA-capping enzyme subunit beta [Physocladia obscura]
MSHSRFQPTMFVNKDPPDDIIRFVSDWLLAEITKLGNDPNIEIEAKLGVLVEKRSRAADERIKMAALTETVISESYFLQNVRFKSEMTLDYHGNFNRLLNKAVEDQRGAIRYTHRYEADKFYSPRRQNGEKVRVSVNKKTDEIIAVIEKTRVANLNVYSPNTGLDYRISINVETPVDAPYNEDEVIYQRDKDRLSYVHQCVQIDLTQVIDDSGKKVHELELEFASTEQILKEKEKLDHRQPNQFQEIVGILIKNVRVLARESNKFK